MRHWTAWVSGMLGIALGCGEAQPAENGAGDTPVPSLSLPLIDESGMEAPVDRVGFMNLEPLSFVDPTTQVPRQSMGAKMFYRFVSAQNDPKNAPVIVLFNGGPGATSMFLMSFGTGPTSLDLDDPTAPAKANPWSLSSLGNLLYIDARGAGFSYFTNEDDATNSTAFSVANFNPTVDAADFVRVVLRVLHDQPALSNNPVVLLGESYGGARSALMLDLLLSRQGVQKRFGPDLVFTVRSFSYGRCWLECQRSRQCLSLPRRVS